MPRMRAVFVLSLFTLLGLLCLVSCKFISFAYLKLLVTETYGTFSVQFYSERVFSPQDL